LSRTRISWYYLPPMEGYVPELIALDLDDTLLRENLSISPADAAAVGEARDAGIRVVLASGRNIHSMRAYAEALGIGGPEGFLICSNGAEILSADGSRVHYRNLMSPQDCREAVALIEAIGLPWQVYEGGAIHVSKLNDWTRIDSGLTGQPVKLIEDPEPYFDRGQLKFVCPGEPGTVASAARDLTEHFRGRLSVLVSKPYFLEILDIRSDKGIALERLAGMLGIERRAVMAVGDAHNDLGMLRWAGLGCAMANAAPEVMAAAAWVSERSNAEDGVAWLIRRAMAGVPVL